MSLLAVVGLGAVPLDAQQDALAGQMAHVKAATRIVEQLQTGEFEALAAAVDPAVPAGGAFSAAGLRKIWEQVREQQGELQSYKPRKSFEVQGRHAVDFDAVFQKQPLTLRVVVDDEGRLSGLWLQPPAPPEPQPAAAYVSSTAFSERDVAIGTDPWKLPGTLSMPTGKGPFPAVVLVHGSGPNDRDETIGPNRPFRDLAGGLASRGIAVLRYDKRTKVHGAAMAAANVGLEEEVVADALTALDTLRHTQGVDPHAVFLLGHSMGAFMAPIIADRAPR